MGGIIHFKCRACDGEIAIRPQHNAELNCPHCKAKIHVAIDDSLVSGSAVQNCISCGHDTLYTQKDFNRAMGVFIVSVGICASLYFFALSQPMLAMGALGATALVDLLAYFIVSEVTVCYSCHAIYRGFPKNPEHEPFDLKKFEKYGGRTPRFGA
jgi:hypothetical protein